MIIIYAKNIYGSGAKIWSLNQINFFIKKHSKDKIYLIANDKFIRHIKNNQKIILKKINTVKNIYIFFLKNFFSHKIKKFYNLGDYPLPFIKHQILYVNQANLIKPCNYKYSSRELKFIIRRLYFDIFKKNIKCIYVQSLFMKKNILKSYSNINKIFISIYNLKKTTLKFQYFRRKTIKIFYPADFYEYKNFNLIENYLLNYNQDCKISFFFLESVKSKIKHPELYKYQKNFKNYNVYKVFLKYDAIVFPSFIESYALPLAEAKKINIPVISANLNYAKNHKIKNIFYFNPNSLNSFSKAIQKLKQYYE
jgi:hypothetical protein